MTEALDIPTEATLAYCRQARRLRHRLKHAPARLHQSLRELRSPSPGIPAEGWDERSVSPVSRVSVIAKEPSPCLLPRYRARERSDHPFDLLVENALEGSTLRFSRRLELLAIADRLGMERFDANLRIATVLHRAGYRFVPEPAKPQAAWTLLAVLAVQAVIFLGALCIWRAIS